MFDNAATAMGLLFALAIGICIVAVALLPLIDVTSRGRYKRPKPTDEGHLDQGDQYPGY